MRISTKKNISQMHFKKASALHSVTIIQNIFHLLQNGVKFQILVVWNVKAGKDQRIFSEQSSVAHSWISAHGCSKTAPSHKHERDLHWYNLSRQVTPMHMPRQQNAKQNDSVQSKEPTEADRKFIMKAKGEKNTSSLKTTQG